MLQSFSHLQIWLNQCQHYDLLLNQKDPIVYDTDVKDDQFGIVLNGLFVLTIIQKNFLIQPLKYIDFYIYFIENSLRTFRFLPNGLLNFHRHFTFV